MKKYLSLFFALIICLIPLTSCGSSDAGSTIKVDAVSQAVYDQFKDQNITINVYNWGQYIADGTNGSIDVNEEFTRLTGIKVNYTTFDSCETMYTKLKTGGANYDVIIPSDYMIGRLINEDMLEELDFENIPNYQNIDSSYKDQSYDPENKYSVPYTWGTVGIIYNSKYVKEAPTGWEALWDEQYSGNILMFDNQRDAFCIAQLLLGYDINTQDESELEQCKAKLEEQKPLVAQYVMDQIYDKMIYEEAYIAPYYAGDFLQMKAENPDLEFVFPSQGYNLYIDACCIPKGAEHKAAAEAYINFLCTAEISGKNMDYVGYSTPISAAREYLSEEMAQSKIAYPDEDTLSRGIAYSALPSTVSQFVDNLWTKVKAS